MDINTRLYGVTELKAKDALRTMDIKERIDELTEQEAKDALCGFINAYCRRCCGVSDHCYKDYDMKCGCFNTVLDEALKE